VLAGIKVKDCFVLLQETDTQSYKPSLLRGQTSSETEAQLVQVFQHADSDLTGMISRQVSHACYCSPAYKAAHSPYLRAHKAKPSWLTYEYICLRQT